MESFQYNFKTTPCEVADVRDLGAEMLLDKVSLREGELDKAGKTMAVFLERYIRPPLTEMATHEETGPESIQLSWSPEEILIRGSSGSIRIPR